MRVEIRENELYTNIKKVLIEVAISKTPMTEKEDHILGNEEVDITKAQINAIKEMLTQELNELVVTVNLSQEETLKAKSQEVMVRVVEDVVAEVELVKVVEEVMVAIMLMHQLKLKKSNTENRGLKDQNKVTLKFDGSLS